MNKEKIDTLEHAGVKGMKWGRRKKRPSKDERIADRQKKLRKALSTTGNLNKRAKLWNEVMKNSGKDSNESLKRDLERLRIENGIRQELKTMAMNSPKSKLDIAKSIVKGAGNLPAIVVDPKAPPGLKVSQYFLMRQTHAIADGINRSYQSRLRRR